MCTQLCDQPITAAPGEAPVTLRGVTLGYAVMTAARKIRKRAACCAFLFRHPRRMTVQPEMMMIRYQVSSGQSRMFTVTCDDAGRHGKQYGG